MYAIEIDHPLKGWTRLAGRWSTYKNARSWLPFVRAAWHGMEGRVRKVEVATARPVS